jgi:hypothetical protein
MCRGFFASGKKEILGRIFTFFKEHSPQQATKKAKTCGKRHILNPVRKSRMRSNAKSGYNILSSPLDL